MTGFSFGGFALGFAFHKLFALAFFIGLLFFVFWALRALKKDQLRNWSVALLAVGLIGLLLSASFGGFTHMRFRSSGGFGFNKINGNTMGRMFDCAKEEACHEEMEELMERMMGIDEK
jgi:peroxiredoxin family protein